MTILIVGGPRQQHYRQVFPGRATRLAGTLQGHPSLEVHTLMGMLAPLFKPKKPTVDHDWPKEVEFILSALEAGRSSGSSRRTQGRLRYHVRAALRLFSDPFGAPPHMLYTRDVGPRALGFITARRLPLGYGGQLELPDRSGKLLMIDCTLLRCRQAAPGWYEGALYFNRTQLAFA